MIKCKTWGRHIRHVERDNLGHLGGGQEAGLATSGGVSRTVAHVPAVSLAQVSAAQSGRKRHGAVAGRAAVHVLETADFGFEFAAFFLFGLGSGVSFILDLLDIS